MIIPNWNGTAWLPRCLQGLREQTHTDFRLVVVDNGSRDDSPELALRAWPDLHLIRHERNLGFAAAANAGLEATDSPYVALLNNDTIPRPHWLAALVATMDAAPLDVGSLASLMLQLERPDCVDSAGDTLSRHGFAHKRGHGQQAAQYRQPSEVLSACAGAALYRRSFLEDAGGFDISFFAYLEDVDLGLRGRWLGYSCFFVPEAEVLHRGHGSGTRHGRYVRWLTRNRLLLITKNWPAQRLQRDMRHLLYGQFYVCVAQKRPFHFLLGWMDYLHMLPQALRARRALMARRRVSPDRVAAWLQDDPGEPPLLFRNAPGTTPP